MTETELEAVAKTESFGMMRAMFPNVDVDLLRRVKWRVKSREKRVRKTVDFVPSPELLADLRTMINPMIREKHGISIQRICDLRKLHGVRSPVHLFPHLLATGSRTRRPKPIVFDKVLDRHNYHNWVHRDNSVAGQAADYLRRFGPVVRCNAKGRYDENGTHWRRNASILTADEIIERAEANGFDARAWARLAA